MTKRLALAVVGVAVIAGGVHAGLKASYPVTVDAVNRQAMGGLATARASVNGNTHIGCYTWITANPAVSYWGYCQARDDNGQNAMCTTTSADLVLAMQNLQGDGRVQFDWDTSFNCTRIGVHQSSVQAPKAP